MSTVRIRLLVSVASTNYAYSKGQEVDAPEDIARDLLHAGHAALANGKLVEKPVEKPEKAISKAATSSEKR